MMIYNFSFQPRNFFWNGYNPFLTAGFFWLIPLLIIDLILKGYALWRAGRNNQSSWFIALLVVNSVGILPLIYLLFFQKPSAGTVKKK